VTVRPVSQVQVENLGLEYECNALAWFNGDPCAHTIIMQDAKSWRSWRLLIALFVLVQLERATTRVIWDVVQSPATSPVAAPVDSETADTDTAADPHGRGSPWPVSTVEVISEITCLACSDLRMHLPGRPALACHAATLHKLHRKADTSAVHGSLIVCSALAMMCDDVYAACSTSRCGEASCTCTQKVALVTQSYFRPSIMRSHAGLARWQWQPCTSITRAPSRVTLHAAVEPADKAATTTPDCTCR
jgi:hypothetical protein